MKPKKIKTSVSISKTTLDSLKRIAKKEDRSISYVLEKFIEQIPPTLPLQGKVNLSAGEKR
jgi:hypothetical protein